MNPARSAARRGVARAGSLLGSVAAVPALLALLSLLSLASCAGPTSATTTADEPTGHTYLSTGVTEAGRPRPLAAGTRVRLEFTGDGRILADAGCSSMGGEASLGDGRVRVVGGLSRTDIGCDQPRYAQDDWLTAFLSAEPSWRVSGHRLVLTADRPHPRTRIVLLDREAADPDRPLLGTRWDVTTLVDGDTASDTASASAGPTSAHLVFSEDEVVGWTGCNGMGGQVTHTGTRLSFGQVISELRRCRGEPARVERHILGVLDGEVTYHVDGDRLTIDGPDGRGLVLTADRPGR
ncbi:META domain-containing protein [Actinopolymorpha singaporensis]|uniref:Heat shock protein HslJ n=1 Tax=Actinopolymorpha singaporensis TaxID=117157 RepID=A0A1H1LH57_9ACTN|nr:META domain-containing protein [Actinopolymorpha singaporensis]SDR73747.1 Heat shock protein HslJ [Actinopolymorpha singaporensis]